MSGDDHLMACYLAGSAEAFDELFRRHAPALLRSLQRRMSTTDASDIVQQTFLQLHRCRNDFKPGAGVRPWIYTIAFNLQRKQARRQKSSKEVLTNGEPALEGSVDTWEALDLGNHVRAAVAELPSEQQRVIALHWFEGLPFEQVAEVVGASLGAVRVRAHRGYVALRKVFERKSNAG